MSFLQILFTHSQLSSDAVHNGLRHENIPKRKRILLSHIILRSLLCIHTLPIPIYFYSCYTTSSQPQPPIPNSEHITRWRRSWYRVILYGKRYISIAKRGAKCMRKYIPAINKVNYLKTGCLSCIFFSFIRFLFIAARYNFMIRKLLIYAFWCAERGGRLPSLVLSLCSDDDPSRRHKSFCWSSVHKLNQSKHISLQSYPNRKHRSGLKSVCKDCE